MRGVACDVEAWPTKERARPDPPSRVTPAGKVRLNPACALLSGHSGRHVRSALMHAGRGGLRGPPPPTGQIPAVGWDVRCAWEGAGRTATTSNTQNKRLIQAWACVPRKPKLCKWQE